MFIDDLKKELKNVNESIYDFSADSTMDFYHSGCYSLNLLTSGSIFKGIAPRIYIFAGPESSGKTFLMCSITKNFIEESDKNYVVYFETEEGVSSSIRQSVGITKEKGKQVVCLPISTVQDFREQSLLVINKFVEHKKENPDSKMMIILDSIGMLSTSKEISDVESGKDTLDMTRAKLIRSAFRILTLKLGLNNIPLVCTNHTYEDIGLFTKVNMSGGKSLYYSASCIIFLSPKIEKGVGKIINAKVIKSRFSKEGSEVNLRILYNKGLDPYYGLLEIAEMTKLITKSGSWYVFPDGRKAQRKTIEESPHEYFTEEFLKELDCFSYPYYNYSTYDSKELEYDQQED